MSGSANFSLERKLFSSTAPVSSWRRRVRTMVAAPRAVGEAKKTSSTTYGWPSTVISSFRFNSLAVINAIQVRSSGNNITFRVLDSEMDRDFGLGVIHHR